MTAISHGAVGTTAELYESFNKVSRMLASKTGIGIDAAQEAAGEALLKIVAKHDERALSAAPGEWSGLLYRYGHFLALHALRREEECRLALGGELLSFATAGWEEAWDGGATPLVAPSPVATVAPTARRAESRADKYRPWSKGEVVAAFIQFRDDHGYPPRVCDLGAANGMPSRPTVLRLFGSTTAARSAAGLEAGRAVRRKWTKGEAEEALRRYVDEVGTWPNSVELNRDSRLPSNKACERLFGTGSVKKLRLMIETPEEGES